MSRRLARELAFQVLFQVDIGHVAWKEALRRSAQENELPKKSFLFLERLVSGTISSLNQIDGILSEFSVEWPLNRMANTDRNILRLAIYELLNLKDVPVEVTVNEAVEMAKVYGEEDSGRFVNGVLGNLIRKISETVGVENNSHKEKKVIDSSLLPEESSESSFCGRQAGDTKQELKELEDR